MDGLRKARRAGRVLVLGHQALPGHARRFSSDTKEGSVPSDLFALGAKPTGYEQNEDGTFPYMLGYDPLP